MTIICDVCPRNCRLEEDGQTGFCNVRKNVNGENVDVLYGTVDYDAPRFAPVMMALFPGCNLRCPFCYCRYLSKREPDISEFREMSPLRLVQVIVMYRLRGIFLLAAEPALHREYVTDVAQLCRKVGLETTLLTSGYLNPWLAENLAGSMSTITVGIKASGNREVYHHMNADPLLCLENARLFWRAGKLDGIQNLIGPGLETPEDDLKFARWLSTNISPDVPVKLIPLVKSFTIRAKPSDDQIYVESEQDTRKRILGATARLREGGLTNVFSNEAMFSKEMMLYGMFNV